MTTTYWEGIPSALSEEERDKLNTQDKERLSAWVGEKFTSVGFNELTEKEYSFAVTFVEDDGGLFGFLDKSDGDFAPLIDNPKNREELAASARDAFLDL